MIENRQDIKSKALKYDLFTVKLPLKDISAKVKLMRQRNNYLDIQISE